MGSSRSEVMMMMMEIMKECHAYSPTTYSLFISNIYKVDDIFQHNSYNLRPHKAYCEHKKLINYVSH
jgi:hypothetical protein